MATVNKSSLRAEFDALKARFESLCVAGTMSADSRALFDALLMLFEVLMAVFMDKHTPKSSANSSLPASQSPNDDTARTRPGAKGKGPSPWRRFDDPLLAARLSRTHVIVALHRLSVGITVGLCPSVPLPPLVDLNAQVPWEDFGAPLLPLDPFLHAQGLDGAVGSADACFGSALRQVRPHCALARASGHRRFRP